MVLDRKDTIMTHMRGGLTWFNKTHYVPHSGVTPFCSHFYGDFDHNRCSSPQHNELEWMSWHVTACMDWTAFQ